jgi:hypothetical protein
MRKALKPVLIGFLAISQLWPLTGQALAGEQLIRVAGLFRGATAVSVEELSNLKGTGLTEPPPAFPGDGATAVILWDELKRTSAPRGTGQSPNITNGISIGVTVTSR